jgi:hypothetical protein
LIVKAVSPPEIDQFAHATAPTTFGELMEIPDSVSGKSKCRKEPHGIEKSYVNSMPQMTVSQMHIGSHN